MKILIIRLSAMGDVALSAPVIHSLSEQYPDAEICLLTRKLFNPFFKGIPNLTFINPDLKVKHKGIFGLFRFYKKVNKEFKPDFIIDLHNVLRSKLLRFLFKLSSVKSYKINKGRKEKKHLVKKTNKNLKQLKHTTQRYIDVFNKAGININLKNISFLKYTSKISSEILNLTNNSSKIIGIAAFAMHKQKQYPLEKMEELISILNEKEYKVYLFGGGEKEKEISLILENKFKNVSSLIGKFSLEEEIAIISKLDLMISMDSANMHIAALTGINIISIWGATHPFAGFSAFMPEKNSFIIQNESLDCRPCSVYGNKKCYKNSLECMNTISPEQIFDICDKALKN